MQVQAIFKIASSQELPAIPETLSPAASEFVLLCLQRDPAARPSAEELLRHPFVALPDNQQQVQQQLWGFSGSYQGPGASSRGDWQGLGGGPRGLRGLKKPLGGRRQQAWQAGMEDSAAAAGGGGGGGVGRLGVGAAGAAAGSGGGAGAAAGGGKSGKMPRASEEDVSERLAALVLGGLEDTCCALAREDGKGLPW